MECWFVLRTRITQQRCHPPATATAWRPRCVARLTATFSLALAVTNASGRPEWESPLSTSAASQSTGGSASSETRTNIRPPSSSTACTASEPEARARGPGHWSLLPRRSRRYGTSISTSQSLRGPPLLGPEATLSRARHTQPLLVSRWRMELQHGSECVTRTSPMRLKPRSQLPRQALPQRLWAEMLEAL